MGKARFPLECNGKIATVCHNRGPEVCAPAPYAGNLRNRLTRKQWRLYLRTKRQHDHKPEEIRMVPFGQYPSSRSATGSDKH